MYVKHQQRDRKLKKTQKSQKGLQSNGRETNKDAKWPEINTTELQHKNVFQIFFPVSIKDTEEE